VGGGSGGEGATESTISNRTTRRITPVLAQPGITPQPAGTRINSKARLREPRHARGITISSITRQAHKGPQPGQPPETCQLINDEDMRALFFVT